MAFPVDILDSCSHDELESLSEDYLSYLRCADPDNLEHLSLRDGREVPISLTTVGYVPLYGGDQTHKVLALFAPEDTLTAVALYLAHQWWTVDDIVRTSNSSRDGLQQVRSLGERIVLYVLNRIIYRKKEMERNEIPFLCHSSSDYAKILWRRGEAIGFYSVKPSGTACSTYLTQSYTLPVLDTMFVRKRYRGKDFALQMIEDFVDSFTEETLGLRYPLSTLMYSACKQYLDKYPGDQELLWEVEGVGHWFQRTLITSILKKEAQRLLGTEAAKPDSIPQCTEQHSLQPTTESQAQNTQDSETEPKGAILTVDTEETPIEPDENKWDASTSEEHDVTPVSTRTRSSQLKRPKIGKKLVDPEPVEDDTGSSDITSRKLDSKEQIVENFKELIQQLAEDKDETDMARLQEEILARPVEHMLCDNQEVQKVPEEKCENKQETELEPVNGDITKDVFEPQLVDAQQITRKTSDTESNLEPDDSHGKSLTTLVSVNMDLEKSFEDSFPDQVLNPEDLETTTHENMITEVEETEIQDEPFKETMATKAAEICITISGEDLTDNGLPGYREANATEECATSDDTPTLGAGSQEEPTVNVTAETLPLLRQGPLLVVELQDVAFQQQSDGQRSVSGEQSEGSVETDQSVQKSIERGGESSSEEVETEIPVTDRRGGLRRKARAYKGPAKRRAKLSA
ncbi:soluble lamin-associated protein of 75 kDa [Mixophyes fleayi]|uniref:soluble lamin-associated protein of 75 kDa n=1 Tax=Mixophyes fleayi TaxID=3061075 RepID=UPI003F4DBDCE